MPGDTPIVIEGGLTRDPELAFAASGNAHVRFSIAVGSRRKNQAGEWEDGESAFWECAAFKLLAEHIADTLHKGDRVIAVGTLRPEKWQDKEGNERRSLKVMVNNIGPSLLFATAVVNKAQRSGGAQGPAQGAAQGEDGSWGNDPWASGYQDAPPF